MCILPNCMTLSHANLSNAGEFSWSCILGVHVKKEKINHGLFFTCTSIPKMSHWRISSRSQAVTVKQCDACRVILLIAFLNSLPLPLWSLKFPDMHSIQLTGTVPKVLYSNKFDCGFNRKTK